MSGILGSHAPDHVRFRLAEHDVRQQERDSKLRQQRQRIGQTAVRERLAGARSVLSVTA